jgi:2-hydroxycyclohexanecarboxyl-CoA dehydrogenase
VITSVTRRVLNSCCATGISYAPLVASFANDKLKESLARAIPLRRLGKPDDYPGAIAFLLSGDAACEKLLPF